MLTLLTATSARGSERGDVPQIECTGLPGRMRATGDSTKPDLRGKHRLQGPVMAAPPPELGTGERPGRKPSRRTATATIRASTSAPCMLVLLESRNQQRRVAGGQCHATPPITSNGARGRSASTHPAQNSRLKPRKKETRQRPRHRFLSPLRGCSWGRESVWQASPAAPVQ